MAKFMVMEVDSKGNYNGWGEREFLEAPRVGEYITADDDSGIGQAYEVIAIIHPVNITQTAGDLILKHVDRDLDLRSSLKNR